MRELSREEVLQLKEGDLLYYSINGIHDYKNKDQYDYKLAIIKYNHFYDCLFIYETYEENKRETYSNIVSFKTLLEEDNHYYDNYRFYEYIPDEQINQDNNQNNKIDYNKHYKGWEIFKFVDDKVLKEGDIIIYNDNDFNYKMLIIVSDTKILKLYIDNKETKEVPSSYFNSAINNAYFTIQQKPLTFQEVLDEKYNGKKFKIEHPTLQSEYNISFENNSLNRILNLLTERVENDKILRQILNEAKFYVEE